MRGKYRPVRLCILALAFSFAIVSGEWLDGTLAAEPSIEIVRDKVYVQRDSGPLAADIYIPRGEGPFPGMLVVHGGAWRFGSRGQLAAAASALAENGYTAIAINYRLAPGHTFPAQLYDCQAAVRWVRAHAKEFKVDPERIGGFGYSAGGHLVALLGTLGDDQMREPGVPADAPSARLQLVLAGGAPCDFRSIPPNNAGLSYWLGGTRSGKPDAYRDASPANFITPDDPPMLFFHGAQDELVPIASPKSMVEQLVERKIKAEFHMVPKAGHLQAITDRDALAHVLAFANVQLKVERHGK